MRFIVRPRLEFAEEGSVANDDGSSDEPECHEGSVKASEQAARKLQALGEEQAVSHPHALRFQQGFICHHIAVKLGTFCAAQLFFWIISTQQMITQQCQQLGIGKFC